MSAASGCTLGRDQIAVDVGVACLIKGNLRATKPGLIWISKVSPAGVLTEPDGRMKEPAELLLTSMPFAPLLTTMLL